MPGPARPGGRKARGAISAGNDNDAATALGAIVLGMLVVLSTILLGVNLLSGLPEDIAYAVLFSVGVFGTVCGVAFLRSDFQPRHQGPPQLQFRNPPRRRKRRKRAADSAKSPAGSAAAKAASPKS